MGSGPKGISTGLPAKSKPHPGEQAGAKRQPRDIWSDLTILPLQLPYEPGGARLCLHRGSKATTDLMPFLLAAHPPADRRIPSVCVILRAALQRNGSQRFPQA
jgi:hypothetical protein